MAQPTSLPDNERIDELEQEVADLNSTLNDMSAALSAREGENGLLQSRLDELDDAVWHAKRGDAREALFAISKAHPDFLPFYDLSTRMGVAP